MQVHRAQETLSLWLTVRRNPGVTTANLVDRFGWGERTVNRRVRAARSAGIQLECRRHTGRHAWYACGTSGSRTGDEPVLERWVDALLKGSLELTSMANSEKMVWLKELSALLMIGTPPFLPHDYVDAYVDGSRLCFTVPQGTSLKTTKIKTYRSRAHA
jgi:hypothetical protein